STSPTRSQASPSSPLASEAGHRAWAGHIARTTGRVRDKPAAKACRCGESKMDQPLDNYSAPALLSSDCCPTRHSRAASTDDENSIRESTYLEACEPVAEPVPAVELFRELDDR